MTARRSLINLDKTGCLLLGSEQQPRAASGCSLASENSRVIRYAALYTETKENTTPFSVNVTRSLVIYQAAQNLHTHEQKTLLRAAAHA